MKNIRSREFWAAFAVVFCAYLTIVLGVSMLIVFGWLLSETIERFWIHPWALATFIAVVLGFIAVAAGTEASHIIARRRARTRKQVRDDEETVRRDEMRPTIGVVQPPERSEDHNYDEVPMMALEDDADAERRKRDRRFKK